MSATLAATSQCHQALNNSGNNIDFDAFERHPNVNVESLVNAFSRRIPPQLSHLHVPTSMFDLPRSYLDTYT